MLIIKRLKVSGAIHQFETHLSKILLQLS